MAHENFDLISVGGGYAGLAAAARAAQLGLKAAVLERGAGEFYPCNSRVAGGVMHVSYHDPMDDAALLARAITEITAGYADPVLVEAMAGNTRRAIEWLGSEGARYESTGSGWRNCVLAPVRPPVTQMVWQGAGADVALRTLEKNLLTRGGVLMRDTQVIDLIMENGECQGVRAKRGDAEIAPRARHVVLADGGFQANDDMSGKYLTPAPRSLKQRNARSGFGDGIRMARAAGAAITELNAFYGHVLARDAMHNDRVWPYPQIDELAASGLLVNAAGQRICDEGMGGVYLANMIAREADPLGTSVVFDEAIWQGPGRAAGIPPNAELINEGGTVHKADTIAALAAKLNVNADGLSATVRDYNAAIASNTIGNLRPARSGTRRKPMPVATAPFYGIPACCGLTYTMGGIRISRDAEVLREDRTKIAGLYAAGASTGGLEGGPAVGYAGGLMKALIFGMLAAEHAAGSR